MALSPILSLFTIDWTLYIDTGPSLYPFCFTGDCPCASTQLCLSCSHAARLWHVGEGAVCTVVTSALASHPLMDQHCSYCSYFLLAFSRHLLAAELQTMLMLGGTKRLARSNTYQLCSHVPAELSCASPDYRS